MIARVAPSLPTRLLTALVGLVALGLTIPSTGYAFSVRVSASAEPTRWAVPLIGYYLQLAGSDNLTPEESQLGVRRGFESWREVACSAIDFQEHGDVPDPSTTLLTAQVANGLNEVVWIEDDSWTLGAFTLGVTLPLHDASTGFIYEADIVFNGYLVDWKLDSGNGTDLESVAVHEIGHMFGMQHNLGPFDFSQPPTMAPNIASFDRSRSLEDDDVMGACFLYPVEPPYLCEDDSECPKVVGRDLEGNEFYTGAFPCALGDDGVKTCETFQVAVTGTANLGEVCTYPEQCAQGYSCTPWAQPGQPADVEVCTQPCLVGDAESCPSGFACVPFPIQPSTGACYPAEGAPFGPGEGPLGCVGPGSCLEGQECVPTPVDGDGELKVCASTCPPDGDNVCDADEICYFFSPDAPIGVCLGPELLPSDEPEPPPEPGVEWAPEVIADGPPEAEGVVEGTVDAGGGEAGVELGSETSDRPEVPASGNPSGCAVGRGGSSPWGPLIFSFFLGVLGVTRRYYDLGRLTDAT